MQPSPMADTSRSLLPSLRVCIAILLLVGLSRNELERPIPVVVSHGVRNPDHAGRFEVVRSVDPADIDGVPAELSDEVRRAPLRVDVVPAEEHAPTQARLELGTEVERVPDGVEDLNDPRL